MTIRVVAKQDLGRRTNVFYLNSNEPKSQQLYMAIMDGLSIITLTAYNLKTDQFEDVTALFQPTFLHKLSQQITNQFHDLDQVKVL
jgi:hypothetical protein